VAGALFVGAVARDEQSRGEGERSPYQLFSGISQLWLATDTWGK
jgi:hypothetical protein